MSSTFPLIILSLGDCDWLLSLSLPLLTTLTSLTATESAVDDTRHAFNGEDFDNEEKLLNLSLSLSLSLMSSDLSFTLSFSFSK